MAYKNTIITLFLIIAVSMAAWLTLPYRSRNTGAFPSAQLPDAYMEGVAALILNKQGKPTMKIVTPKMVHYAENDTTQLTSPQLTLYRKSPQPWYITSKYAKATEGIDHVNFWEDVIIHHAADQNNPATLIKTATLMVSPYVQTAETADLITLIQPNFVVNALGMFADMSTGNIKLLSQTKGEYSPDV